MTSSNSNKPVTVYGNTSCPYCGAATLLAEMQERSGQRSVPQIFVGDAAVGGFDELSALDKSGELDKMLAG